MGGSGNEYSRIEDPGGSIYLSKGGSVHLSVKVPGIYFDKVKFDELAEDFLADYRMAKRAFQKQNVAPITLKSSSVLPPDKDGPSCAVLMDPPESCMI